MKTTCIYCHEIKEFKTEYTVLDKIRNLYFKILYKYYEKAPWVKKYTYYIGEK